MASSPLTQWDRLVRYVSARDGQVRYGEPIVSGDKNVDIDDLAQKGGLKVKVLEGASPLDAAPTGAEDEVGRLLGPLTPADVKVVRCVGLNYRTHILETGFELPKNPTVFFKTGQAVSDTRSPVPIPRLAQDTCDYEGELTLVIGRDCKNVTPDRALDYVAAYTAGNDVSCRSWQMEKDKAGSAPQWSFSKTFDKYAPLGPCLVAGRKLGDGSGLEMKVYVNGELRQHTNTSDLCFGVRELVAFLSTGQTLEKGTLIMTGTPGGVGLGFKPPRYLKHGDEVVVEIEGIGKLVNTMEFE
ncbi:hypothetical protein M433DRAFT_59165 [Acidomyces richmondensis BFW]|nr:MAG: hypothetical protein FE78DRAFT_154073 [Acidomyces sp. 'richmondensis']KYG49420.1 hypothetical protein M433DRAFT_59165 [Acidomyces richmondensis BFW]